jgi:hypothetical protein
MKKVIKFLVDDHPEIWIFILLLALLIRIIIGLVGK